MEGGCRLEESYLSLIETWVGVDDSSSPTGREDRDLTAGDVKPPGEQCRSKIERKWFQSLGKHQWIRCCAGLTWEDAGVTGSVRPGSPCWCKSRWLHRACSINQQHALCHCWDSQSCLRRHRWFLTCLLAAVPLTAFLPSPPLLYLNWSY